MSNNGDDPSIFLVEQTGPELDIEDVDLGMKCSMTFKVTPILNLGADTSIWSDYFSLFGVKVLLSLQLGEDARYLNGSLTSGRTNLVVHLNRLAFTICPQSQVLPQPDTLHWDNVFMNPGNGNKY
jgi:hypothetical protein